MMEMKEGMYEIYQKLYLVDVYVPYLYFTYPWTIGKILYIFFTT